MEPIIDYIRRNLRAAGPKRWRAIAAESGCAFDTLRKIAYSDSDNPGLKIAQRLIDFFQAVERGERELPPPQTEPVKAEAA